MAIVVAPGGASAAVRGRRWNERLLYLALKVIFAASFIACAVKLFVDVASSCSASSSLPAVVTSCPPPPVCPSTSLATTGKSDDTTAPNSFFNQVYEEAFQRTLREATTQQQKSKRKRFVLNRAWNRTKGGLADDDRRLLGKLYFNADSVMEYGLGESTYIAGAVTVPRYVGIDSDAVWVAQARDMSPTHFQFFSGDIGKTVEWGFPAEPKLSKSMLLYEVLPLWSQARAFDVYFIDGRWRPACVLLSFLHSSSRLPSEKQASNPSYKVLVGIHDYVQRTQYHRLEEVLVKVTNTSRLAVFQRKPTTTDEDIWKIYMYYDQLCRENLPPGIENDVDKLRDLGC